MSRGKYKIGTNQKGVLSYKKTTFYQVSMSSLLPVYFVSMCYISLTASDREVHSYMRIVLTLHLFQLKKDFVCFQKYKHSTIVLPEQLSYIALSLICCWFNDHNINNNLAMHCNKIVPLFPPHNTAVVYTFC